ncbi:bifunctional UDP-sugar hydrolase/5'-nucleotidase [Phycicoccus sp. Root101]|uniref:bifunctional metallophosphatase/5'-nucleotidase n=1 Tax=Phycicoccus sp. Root101 TaxID=1736421 RepID=UPI000702D335|nr:bifunctional metallophosphatase/5'-nucleotidase [Phycicoccus sp. Root101]KQU67435.1 multifunctional 2',3'-cyclic-nucleotide 2'-phosphodiesterase/5'-nucleotidase/3'-nucleotidase [Phycicoccus sp. Root101]
MTSLRTRRLSGVVAVAAMAAAGLAMTGGSSTAAPNGPTMDIQLLSFNDFHGNLQPPSGSSGRVVTDHKLVTDPKTGVVSAADVTTDAGGSEYLATHLKEARKGHPYSLTVAAGDLIGASPFLSAAFHDEPTIEAMNALHLDASAVGNHEFDEGYKELQRMANGGCLDDGAGANNQDSCPGGKTFTGANFDYLAANVVQSGTNKTILPPYTIRNIKGAKIGFIGMTLKDTPSIVTAAGVAGLQFKDEVATANALVPVLRSKGVNAIVVLIHQGGVPNQQVWYGPDNKPYTVNPTYDYTCGKGGSLAPDSPILPIAKGLDPAIDMIVSGHTHQPYVCDVKDPKGQPRMVTSASSFGRLFTDTDLTYDRRTQDIVRTSVKSANMIVSRDVPKDAAQTKIITDYSALARPIASRVLGKITTDVTRTGNAGGESQLGDLIADAQLADPSVVTAGKKPDIAFMNPGGIRADLSYANSPYNEAPGDVVFEEAFTVQPFNNYLVSLDLTGAQVKQLLTEQWSGSNAGSGKKILQVNKAFNYTYTGTTLGAVTLNGQPLVDTQTYRIVTNNFLQGGGDNFPTMAKGTNVYYGGLDIDAFANYLEANSPYTPGPLTRISGS